MTVADLYQKLSWEGTERSLGLWRQQANGAEVEEPDGEWLASWRQTLLAYALPQSLTGLEDWSKENQDSARSMLVSAGVWDQVVEILVQNDLVVHENGN